MTSTCVAAGVLSGLISMVGWMEKNASLVKTVAIAVGIGVGVWYAYSKALAVVKAIQTALNDACNYIYLCQPNWIAYFRNDISGYVYYNDELPRYYHLSRKSA